MKEVIGFMGKDILVSEGESSEHRKVVVEDDGTLKALSYQEFNKRYHDEKKKEKEAGYSAIEVMVLIFLVLVTLVVLMMLARLV